MAACIIRKKEMDAESTAWRENGPTLLPDSMSSMVHQDVRLCVCSSIHLIGKRYKRPAKIYLWGWVQVVGARALSSHCHSSDGMPARVAAWAVSKEITVPTFTKLASSEDLGPELEPIPEQPETAPAPDRSLPVNATISGRAQMLILSGLCLQTVCDVMLRSWSRRTLGETYSSSSVLMVRQPPAQLAQGPAISPSISHPHEPSGCRAR